MIRIGIYGGTFSPPHNGHIAAAKAFMEQMWLDFLYVIPTGTPPHKEMDVPMDAAHRLEMCRLAFANVEGVYNNNWKPLLVPLPSEVNAIVKGPLDDLIIVSMATSPEI